MLTRYHAILKQAASLLTALSAALAFCALTGAKAHAQPAPPNNNVTNAQGIMGSTGSAYGTNLYVVAQTNAPAGDPFPAEYSIWYEWTAPITSMMDFNTRNSTDANGNPLDTVLVVYALKTGATNVAWTNLTAIATNDDDSNTNWGVTSRASFQANLSQMYVIQVDGSQKSTPGTSAQGYISLNWLPSLQGGGFGFSASYFPAGSLDDYIEYNDASGSISPSIYGHTAGSANERITVTRTGGFTGRCQVTLILTNGFYTNIYYSEAIGSNILVTNYTDATLRTVLSYTNIYQTNLVSEDFFANDYYGTIEYLPLDELIFASQTNDTFNPFTPVNTFTVPLGTFGLVDFLTNFLCAGNYSLTSGPISNADGTYTVALTNVFCTNFVTNVAVPAAFAGIHYTPYSNTLTFDDFQMSQDVYVSVDPVLASYPAETSPLDCPVPGPEDYYYFANCTNLDFLNSDPTHIYTGLNASVQMILTNVVLDPTDDQDILPPKITQPTADLNILNYWGNPNPVYTNLESQVVINFERETFRVNRNAGTATLWVQRYPRANAAGYTCHYTIDTQYAFEGLAVLDWNDWAPVAGADYAVPSEGQAVYDFTLPTDPSWTGISGTLTFPPAPNIAPQPIQIPIVNNGSQEFDEDIYVELYQTYADYTADTSAAPPAYLGNIQNVHLTINFDNTSDNLQPGGALDRNWNIDNSLGSQPPGNSTPGATGGGGAEVNAVAVQSNDETIIGGYFNSYNQTNVYNIARLQQNGFLDASFNTGTGINNGLVSALAIDSAGRVIVGGTFSSYNSANTSSNILRLTSNGTYDPTFVAGVGFNGPVQALWIDASGNILVAGNFTQYNTTNVNNIVRLLPTGGLDASFYPNMGNGLANYGTDLPINAVTTDNNQNVIIGGEFQNVNGAPVNYIARLLPNGTLDTTFNPGVGPDDEVNAIAVTTNNEVLIGGDFQNYELVSRNYVALVNTNGVLDTSFTSGSGADAPVYSVLIQPDGNALIGGSFTSYNGSRRIGLARILPQGWLDTSFMDTSYNQFAGLVNNRYIDQPNTALAMALEPTGNIMVGGMFFQVGGGSKRDDLHPRENMVRIIGAATAGPETGGIGNYPGNVTFTQNPYNVLDTSGNLYITLDRTNGSLGPIAVTLATNTLAPGPGDATAADYGLEIADPVYVDIWDLHKESFAYGWRKSDGYSGLNTQISGQDNGDSGAGLSIYNDPTAQQNLLAGLSLLNVNSYGLLNLGGVPIPTAPAYGTPASQVSILNNDLSLGIVGFSANNFTTVDTTNSVTITVVRTNGSAGSLTINYDTADGTAHSAANPPDYTAVPSTSTLTFGPGITTATFKVKIGQFNTVQGTKIFHVNLINNSTNSILDSNILPTTATVTIIDGNFVPGHLAFTSTNYLTLKGGAATVGVERIGGAVGVLQVQCGTSDGTGVNGLNYVGVTNTLVWSNQDISVKTMTIQTLQNNTVEGTKTANVSLFNATNIGNSATSAQILTSPTSAVLDILDTDSYGDIGFAVPNFNILMNAEQALVTVIRTNGITGTVQVGFATLNDTNTVLPYQPAYAGTNYGQTNGTLVFGPNVTSQSFIVPIYNTGNGESSFANRQLTLELFAISNSPAANSNQFPIFATLTILDTNLVVGTAGSIDLTTENGSGFNNTVYSLALQPDGGILAGGDFNTFNQYPFNNVARLLPVGQYDVSFLYDLAGPNSNVLQILSQPLGTSQSNGPVMIVGAFSQVNGVNRNGVARLNVTGSLDESFNPGSGADGAIYSMAGTLVPTIFNNNLTNVIYSQAYYVGGAFANFDGIPIGGITRLNAATNSPGLQGTVDSTFNLSQGVTSASGTVRVVAVQPNNQVVAGGDFTAFNGQTNNHLVRLNPDGSVDTSFNPSTGSDPGQTVRAMLVQPDGKILVGGSFTNVNGSGYNYLARLNTDGSVDTNFNLGAGANNAVLTLALDSQQRILVGGQFSRFSGVTRSGITRLNPDGTVDPTINFGSASDGGFIDSIVIQTNDEIDIGGGFTTFEGASENDFVRVYGGANYGDGSIQFTTSQYGVLQNGTNLTILLQRLGGEGTLAQPTVSVVFSTSDGTAQSGVDYIGVTNTVVFPYGETFETVTVPLINNILVGSNKYFNLNLSSPVYATIGSQYPSAIVTITNVNTAVSFSASTYRQTANAPSSNAIIAVSRLGDPNSTFSITVYTGTNGTATPYTNYIPTTNILTFNPGISTQQFLVPLLNASNQFGDVTVDLEMANPSNVFIGSPSSATLTIASVLSGPGYLAFSQTNYFVSEGATNAYITIVRTNGSSGTVSVVLTTSNDTAVAGVNYQPVSITNIFPDGSSTPQVVAIPVFQQTAAGPDTTVYLTLSNPTGGAVIGGTNVEILTIQNDFENFFITNSPYFVGEGASSITVGVVRAGPASNTAAVNYTTFTPPNATEAEGYALPNIDYVPNSGTLVFNPNVTFETVPISILQGSVVNGPLTFQMVLSDPTNLSSADTNIQLGVPSAAPITILSDVTGFEFATNAYGVAENGSNIVVWVTRINPGTNTASVQFSTADGTAVNQVDYLATNGTLVFSNGMISNSFSVPIVNENVVENNKSFNLLLSNPKVLTIPSFSTNAYLLSPSNATVTISNVLTGVAFSSPAYSVSECSATVTIPVVLTGSTNNLVSVNYETSNGSGQDGTNYFGTHGSLQFLPGQTQTNFTIQIINNHIIGPDHTVILTLFGVEGAQLLNPSTAVLTIEECNGAYIVKSGTAFVSGTFPGNVPATSGVLFSNETVTMLFGLRDVAGVNTTNLMATLLATNGVTNVSAPQSYGALAVGGPTAARPFTFTIEGTNGQNIVANFTLKDGSQVYSNVAFGFTLGGNITTYSTNEILLLNGTNSYPIKATNSNPPDYGYPSTINVSGVVGEITSVSASVSNFGHTYPEFVEMLLVSPTGQASYLMYGCGSQFSVSHLNLTFSQTASNSLPLSSIITSGTYLPTDFGYASFPSNQIGLPSPPLPSVIKTNLNTFVGYSPNGSWSLYLAYNDTLDQGYISNGWSLNLGTGAPVEQDSDLQMTMTSAPGMATLSNTLVYTIGVTNYGPSAATNILITDTLPPGATYVTNNCNCGVGTNGILTFTAPSLAVSNGVLFTVTIIPSELGYITNIAVATADQPDPNSNNVQTNVQLVSPESADLGVDLSSAPNPVLDGANVTYTIVVTNNGASFATGVTAVDVLPVGFLPSAVSPTNSVTFSTNGSVVSITWNLGTIQANAAATLSITAGVDLPENTLPSLTNLDSVSVSSSVYDPAKFNNFASVKTEVEPAVLTLLNASASKLMLTWPITSGYILQGATNLPANPLSTNWVSITNANFVIQQLVEGQMKSTYTLPGNTGFRFFRLKSQLSQIH